MGKLRYGLRYTFGRPPTGAPESILKVKHVNAAHSFWKRFWETHASQAAAQRLSEANKRIDVLVRRLEKMKDLHHAGETDGAATMRATTRGRARKVLEAELEKLRKQTGSLANYTVDLAVKEFTAATRRSFLSCRNYLPVELGLFP